MYRKAPHSFDIGPSFCRRRGRGLASCHSKAMKTQAQDCTRSSVHPNGTKQILTNESNPQILKQIAFFALVADGMADSGGALLAAGCVAAVGVAWAVLRRRQPEETGARQLNVVVTGSTRGLGFALAKEHVRHGDSVMISGRRPAVVEEARRELEALVTVPGQKVAGHACDVASLTGCDSLAAAAKLTLGSIDLWVNNAGVTQHPKAPLVSTPAETVQNIVATNLMGSIFGCRAALRIMLEQGHGCVFNMDGSGSRGNASPRSAAYGASKAAIPQLSKTLARELPRDSGCCVHTASPGMVTTDLLLKDATPSSKRIFNILADTPETVAQWLVPRMRAATNRPSGDYIRYLTPTSVVWRFATASWRKDRLVKVTD